MTDVETLGRMLDRPCNAYVCDDADELAATVAELRSHQDSWHYLHEAAVDWAGHKVPYALVVHDTELTVVFGGAAIRDLPQTSMDGLVDAAVNYFAMAMTTGGGA